MYVRMYACYVSLDCAMYILVKGMALREFEILDVRTYLLEMFGIVTFVHTVCTCVRRYSIDGYNLYIQSLNFHSALRATYFKTSKKL